VQVEPAVRCGPTGRIVGAGVACTASIPLQSHRR
jgi:hypothetical protein